MQMNFIQGNTRILMIRRLKYKFKIKDLQKSKHVLTHRTTEMRASLEPKEQRIEDLKDQLLNLEKVFERQMQRMNQLGEELAKKQSKIN